MAAAACFEGPFDEIALEVDVEKALDADLDVGDEFENALDGKS